MLLKGILREVQSIISSRNNLSLHFWHKREGNSFTQGAYELLKNIYKEIFLDKQRDYYFPILVERQHKNKWDETTENSRDISRECDGH